METIIRGIASYVLAFALGLFAASASADYPDRPVRLIVPFPPGGNIDATARIVANGLAEQLGVSVIVENRPGAAGMVGSEYVAKAPPDGYTSLLGSTGSFAPGKALNPSIPLDPVKDFVSASPITRAPLVLSVNRSIPVNTVAELIAYAKAHPGKLTVASSGTGTAAHLTAEYFQTMSGVKFLHVPYKGSGPAISDLIGGQVDMTFDQLASSLPQIQAGKLHALGVTTLQRTPLMPDLPTLAESGLPGFESSTTTALMFPAGTPRTVIERVNAAMRVVLANPDTRQKFAALGSDVLIGSGEDFDVILRGEMNKWAQVVNVAGIKLP